MAKAPRSQFSAAEHGLGYVFQGRFALLKALSMPENTAIVLEKDDDVEFIFERGERTLASLKHKAIGDKLTNLDVDFWKSVRVWLAHYTSHGRLDCSSRFLLFTTGYVAPGSALEIFTGEITDEDTAARVANDLLAVSETSLSSELRARLAELSGAELRDFYSRITILDTTSRITEIPGLIDQYLRTVRRQFRPAVFERLEGWWSDLVIRFLAGERTAPILVHEIADKLAAVADEYRTDNLPITFRNREPGAIDAANDPRLFVEQLRHLNLAPNRIRNAIVDYYRAFEQRSHWARENLLIDSEIDFYEDRLAEEWGRYRDVVFETLDPAAADDVLIKAGRELYKWAELETGMLRIRERVTESYVVRGTFHILANLRPEPRVYWHPQFLERLKKTLEPAA
jgi:hypothetical protein